MYVPTGYAWTIMKLWKLCVFELLGFLEPLIPKLSYGKRLKYVSIAEVTGTIRKTLTVQLDTPEMCSRMVSGSPG